jgi:hypothetical protein
LKVLKVGHSIAGQHSKPIRAVQMDATRIVTGCYDKNVYLFDFEENNNGQTIISKLSKNKDKNCIVS